MGTIVQTIGMIGAVILILSYFLVSRGSVSALSWKYHALNLSGAVAILVNSLYCSALGPAFLNILWACIAIFHLFFAHPANRGSRTKDA